MSTSKENTKENAKETPKEAKNVIELLEEDDDFEVTYIYI